MALILSLRLINSLLSTEFRLKISSLPPTQDLEGSCFTVFKLSMLLLKNLLQFCILTLCVAPVCFFSLEGARTISLPHRLDISQSDALVWVSSPIYFPSTQGLFYPNTQTLSSGKYFFVNFLHNCLPGIFFVLSLLLVNVECSDYTLHCSSPFSPSSDGLLLLPGKFPQCFFR